MVRLSHEQNDTQSDAIRSTENKAGNDHGADKVSPNRLELRARPKPVTRINRKVLYAGSAIILVFISGVVLIALDPPDWNDQPATELLVSPHSKTPEGLEKLPSSYDAIPKLGPPNPGDLGKSIARLERDLNIPVLPPSQTPGYRPDPEEDFKRSERIRLARLAAKANESKLFFNVETKAGNGQSNIDNQNVRSNVTSNGEAASSSNNAFDPLAALAALENGSGPSSDPDPDGQQAKLAFLNQEPDQDIYNPHSLQKPISPYQLMAGTIISASLITGLNSDLPGMVIAQITEQIYDSVTGHHLLIPQGSRLIGKYDSNIAFGQNRALVIWQRIIRPDGSSIIIDNLPVTDEKGYAGLQDQVDYHTFKLAKGIALATLFNIGTELSFSSEESDLVKALRQSLQDNTNEASQQIIQRQLDIQPTIKIRPGWPIRIIIHKDIILPPMEEPNP